MLLLLNEIKIYINHQLNTFTKLKKNNVEKKYIPAIQNKKKGKHRNIFKNP